MDSNRDMLITRPVSKLLFQFSLPAIGGMIINSLYNLVDRIFVGRIGGLAMTGIGLSLPFMMLLSAVSSLIGIGASSLISIKLEINNKEEASGIIWSSPDQLSKSLTSLGLDRFVRRMQSHPFNNTTVIPIIKIK